MTKYDFTVFNKASGEAVAEINADTRTKAYGIYGVMLRNSGMSDEEVNTEKTKVCIRWND